MKRLVSVLTLAILAALPLFSYDYSIKTGFGWGFQDFASISDRNAENPTYIKGKSYNFPYLYVDGQMGFLDNLALDFNMGLSNIFACRIGLSFNYAF